MMKRSAGLLLYRKCGGELQVLLAHPGGPFWAKKDEGAWSIPKGEFEDPEEPLAAARREFEEEMGSRAEGEFIPLTPVRQSGAKMVYAWALHSDFDCSTVRSNNFSMEWPPNSGRQQEFPEVDRAEWFPVEVARMKILKGQAPLLDELTARLNRSALK